MSTGIGVLQMALNPGRPSDIVYETTHKVPK